ncbi:transient receptor potential cation channel subfamily V member 5 [Strongylocentrotus purpuratus]|uniref:Ion transport domain-containing protein n=1 Tax=Strongylocentrotus purpuratus TaxID=7668 RepID=A0A7M7RBR9_STRPU|nr:transient receptor potential cation channel subfamily V member 5 [Strongylocentrotus purpuratus]|eukprot:XP_786430.2 PREDICTED: transient receptor potential cation channel subfamily V member 5 [Strongylocentrotus purpuratus]
MGARKTKLATDDNDGNRKQVDDNSQDSFQLYSLVNLKGGGELVELTREGIKTKDWKPLEDKLRSESVKRFLYNHGQGKDISIKELVNRRNQSRTEKVEIIGAASRQHSANTISPVKAGAIRKVCWDLDQRGAVGETILHLCFLNATELHSELAKRIIKEYPLLVNDIFHTDLYQGESCLHFAIVNEDFTMVKFLVENGANIDERACGTFFLPDDQKNTRKDTYDHEVIVVDNKTNYHGHTYFGEYPLSFAACLEQEDILRYLWSKGADVNAQDCNGNTILHMTILHKKRAQFTQAFELGASCSITNYQGYTPLCLAAELADIEFFESIIHLERQVSWKYGDVTCALYPLYNLDSIGVDGSVNEKSALFTIVNQSDIDHLGLMKGLMTKLLHEKWKTFGRFQFYLRMGLFIFYLILLTTAFYLRPGKDRNARDINVTDSFGNTTVVHKWNRCYLLYSDTTQDKCRLAFECMTVFGAIMFLYFAARELHHLKKLYWNVLRNAPAKAMFLLSCFFVILACFGRIPPCAPYYEDVLIILCVLTACPYFLFFLRVYALVGPFIFMIYKMIQGDLLKFLLLYLIFFIGFSQAMHIVFLSSVGAETNFIDSAVNMFVMSLGEFGDVYEKFDETRYPHMAKFLFFVYMVLVTLLLVNMLIAMMGNTFSTIANADYEWQRQWAKVVLVLEQSLSPEVRHSMQLMYSQPVWEGLPGRAMVQQTERETHDDREVQKSRQRNSRNTKMKYIDGEWVPPPMNDRPRDSVLGAHQQGDSKPPMTLVVPETKIIPPDGDYV